MSDDAQTRPSRPAEFPFSDWQVGVEHAANRLNGRLKHCARSAFHHLRKAWQLHGVDDEMSAFRALTAEEEAATSIIEALKRQRYPGAEKLQAKSHIHKCSIWPLVRAVNHVMSRVGLPPPQVVLSRSGKPHLKVSVNITALAGIEGAPMWAQPDHPLNFAIRSGSASKTVIASFEEELAQLASLTGEQSISSYMALEANQRNLLLYASDHGIPHVSFSDDMLIERGRRVSVLLTIMIAIAQTPVHQIFVVQCLEAILRALKRIEGGLFDYDALKRPFGTPQISIERSADAGRRVVLRRDIHVEMGWAGLRHPWSWEKPRTVNLRYQFYA